MYQNVREISKNIQNEECPCVIQIIFMTVGPMLIDNKINSEWDLVSKLNLY